MKNIRIVHGTLMYPLEVGSRALIFEEGRYLHTSTVIAIHGVTPLWCCAFSLYPRNRRSKNVCVGVSCRKPESHLDTLRDL